AASQDRCQPEPAAPRAPQEWAVRRVWHAPTRWHPCRPALSNSPARSGIAIALPGSRGRVARTFGDRALERNARQVGARRGPPAPVLSPALGVGLSRLLPRVLAGARPRRVGRALGGDRLPAAA